MITLDVKYLRNRLTQIIRAIIEEKLIIDAMIIKDKEKEESIKPEDLDQEPDQEETKKVIMRKGNTNILSKAGKTIHQRDRMRREEA